MIKGIAHVCYTVRDLDVALDFYQGKLGLPLAFEFVRESGERFGVYLQAGGRNFVELFQGELGEGAGKTSYSHLCLEVEDIEGTAAALRAQGLEVTPVTMGGDGTWQCWLADPEGNRIELHEYTAESRQGPYLADR